MFAGDLPRTLQGVIGLPSGAAAVHIAGGTRWVNVGLGVIVDTWSDELEKTLNVNSKSRNCQIRYAE